MQFLSSVNNLITKLKNLSKIKKILLVISIIGLGYLVYPKPDENKISYQTSTITTGSITEVVSETGEIMSTGMTNVVSTTTGIVQKVYVENRQKVKRGDKLYYVESSATTEERNKAYASYLSAKNSVASATAQQLTLESDMWVAHELYETKVTDLSLGKEDPTYIEYNRDWQAAEAKYLNQAEVIKATKASVAQTYSAYSATIDSYVTAPISGTIANLAVAPGQSVSSSSTSLIIASEQDTWVKLTVSEADITAISPDQQATVSVDALSGETFEATVKRVDKFGTDNGGVITYNVYLSLTNPSVQILPAMTVQVDITTAEAQDVVIVDNSAIKPYQGDKAVQIISKSGNTIYLPITLGLTGSTHSQVLTGLEVGDEIIVSQSTTSSDKSPTGGIFGAPGGGSK